MDDTITECLKCDRTLSEVELVWCDSCWKEKSKKVPKVPSVNDLKVEVMALREALGEILENSENNCSCYKVAREALGLVTE